MSKNSFVIAAFDFDGTITNKDTLFDFIHFYFGMPRMILGVILLSPVLILFKLGFIKNNKAKQILFSYFFKGKKIDDFDDVCQKYSARVGEILRPKAIDEIKEHQQEGHLVIIDSASICNWIAPWAKQMGVLEVIGTRIEIENGIITGKFFGENCYGQEKVRRLLELYPNRDTYELYAYGDSSGDKELLEIADYPYYRKF
ncbi:MAG: HAD-IB family hydrolase [Dysgonomonas sp.]